MIVFVVDGANRDEFAQRFAMSFPKLSGQFRVVDYPALAHASTLPAATFAFLDLRTSTPGRKRLAAELADGLRREGCPVLGSFSDDPLPMDRPDAPTFPCVLRAEAPDSIAESSLLTSESDRHEIWRDWVLQGTEPERIRAFLAPGTPDADGWYRRRGFLHIGGKALLLPTLVSRQWPGEEGASRYEEAEPGIPEALAPSSAESLVRVEYWSSEGEPQLWRIDDTAGFLFRPPLDRTDVARTLEEELAALCAETPEQAIPIQWASMIGR